MEEKPQDSAEPQTVRPDNDTETINQSCRLCQSVQFSAAWSDVHKARLLSNVAGRDPNKVDPEAANALSDRLMPNFIDGSPECDPTSESAASSRSLISEHQFLVSVLDSHLEEWGEPAYRFKAYLCRLAFDLDTLMQVDAPELVKSLGLTFKQIGLDAYHGALVGFLQGEVDPVRNLCRFSLSGIASKGPARLIRKLGRFPIFRDFPFGDAHWDEESLRDPFIKRVSVRKVHGPAHHEAELYQHRWPQCPTILNAGHKFERIEDHRALPELVEAKILLWLDRFKVSDLTLLVGVTDDGVGVQCDSAFNGS